MDRRDFLKLASWSGLAVAAPVSLQNKVWAQEDMPLESMYASPYFYVSVHAGGGWDPTSLCDPKGMLSETQDNPMNMYPAGDIPEYGALKCAPEPGIAAFFEKYYQQLLVINGIDTSTNGHESGTRNTWSGTLMEGYPSFTALVAGVMAPHKPLAFITNGGYDVSAGVVAPTRVGDTGLLERLAKPNVITPGMEGVTYHTPSTMERIRAIRDQKLQDKVAGTALPAFKHKLNTLFTVRQGANELKLLQEYLPEELDMTNNPLRRQAQLALAAYKSGLAVSANMSIGGFDSHSDNDNRQFSRLNMLLEGVDFLMEEAAAQGVSENVVVVVSSDFGRTPGYNAGNGKDHWSITSALAMGPGIVGNRVVGVTDYGHKALNIDPTTFEEKEDGVRVTPAHIHAALRDHAGIESNQVTSAFPLELSGGKMPLFG